MKRQWITAALIAVIVCGWGLAARAQEADVYTDAHYYADCDCVVASVSDYLDFIAEFDYSMEFSWSFSDTKNTYYTSGSVDWEGEVDNVPMGDTYYMDAQVNGMISPEYENCVTGGCGQHCTLHGCDPCLYCCFMNQCPAEYMPFELDETSSTSADATCGEGADLDTLVNEYAGISSSYPFPAVNCASPFYSLGNTDPLIGYVSPESAAYSNGNSNNTFVAEYGSDIEDWVLITIDLYITRCIK